jgi:hypothetical protein
VAVYLQVVAGIDKMGKQRSLSMVSLMIGFCAISDKDQGNLFDLIQQRFSTHANTCKQFYISTPKIGQQYRKDLHDGDQRKWNVPCPKCGAYIEIKWFDYKNGEPVGIVFEKMKQIN